MSKKALITGVTGQDGSYLTELLLFKGYEVHGIVRRASTMNRERIDHIHRDEHEKGNKLFIHYGDLADGEQISDIIYNVKPDEVYHLGAQSHVRVSFDIAEYSGNVTGLGTTRILEAIRRGNKKIKFYQASSSEMFGSAKPPQNENTIFEPRSPYACAKLYAYWMARNYREGYNLFICNGILFNHESPRRGENFVTRKVTMGIAAILSGKQKYLYMGNLEAKRDWGFTPDYVEAIHKMLQHKTSGDYFIGTGETHSVKEFIEKAFAYAGLDWKKHVKIDPRYYRATEVDVLLADNKKAVKTLKWVPKVTFADLIKIMVDSDMRKAGLLAIGQGDRVIKEKFKNKWWSKD